VRLPEIHVLSSIPLPVARSVVSSVVKFLHDPAADDVVALPTEAHVCSLRLSSCETMLITGHSVVQVRWAMDSIGHAFTLPLEDADVMQYALNIYTRW